MGVFNCLDKKNGNRMANILFLMVLIITLPALNKQSCSAEVCGDTGGPMISPIVYNRVVPQ